VRGRIPSTPHVITIEQAVKEHSASVGKAEQAVEQEESTKNDSYQGTPSGVPSKVVIQPASAAVVVTPIPR